MSDADELRALARGDESAFEALFRTWHPRLVAYAATLDPGGEEDIVQTVFARLWRNRTTLEIDNLRAYLYAAVRNGALNRIARRRTERDGWQQAVEEELARRGEALPPTPLAALQADEVADIVRRAIDRLPARRREVVLLRWRHGLPHIEIARLMGISVKGVENHVTRALKQLREQFEDRDPR